MPSSKVPRRLRDIIDDAEAILRYREGMDFNYLSQQTRKTYEAVERCLERISEAVMMLGDMAVDLMADQPW